MVGQAHITRTLRNAIANDRVHHAYLFCGVRGLGKTTAARILAKCLVCERGPTPDPCNECEQCLAITESRSTDVLEIDGASNNSVDDIRSLREQVHYLPQSARRKIYIIDEVHMLSTSAFNALLKTLEEPPPHVTFLFATTDPHKVIPTILSRVSRLDFRRVRSDELVEHLRRLADAEAVKISDDALDIVAGAAGGSVRDALTALDKVIAFADDPKQTTIAADEVRAVLGLADRLAVAELVQAVFDGDPRATLERFDAITRVGADIGQLALVILRHLRDVAVVGACGRSDALLDLPARVVERVEHQAQATDPAITGQYFDRFARVLEAIEFARAPRLVAEMALLDLARAEPVVPIGELVTRLERLSSGSSVGAGGSGGGSAGGASPRGGERSASRSEGARHASTSSVGAASTSDERVDMSPSPVATPRGSTVAGNDRTASETADATATKAAGARPPGRAPGAGPGGISDQLWAIVQGEPPARAQPRQTPPPAPRAAFALAPTEPAAEPAVALPASADAGCLSSRFTPRPTIDLDRVEPFAAWESFLDLVRGEDELLFAVLADFGLIEVVPGRLRLAAVAGSFAAESIRRPDLRAQLDTLLSGSFGAMSVEFEDMAASEPDAPSLAQVEARRRREHAANAEREARAHPHIRALLDTFGARITVNPLGEPPRT
jgi:DNA polymerase-3 subunit gamma/tau